MDSPNLSTRSHRILNAIIQTYTEMASPVGSAYLSERYQFGVSPATIRNAMAHLEDLGLITHPHTSAGRVPTDMGYRYYVDLLMEPGRLTKQESSQLESLRQNSSDVRDSFLGDAADLLSELTQAASLVLVPELAQGVFRRFEFIPIGPHQVVGVLISDQGMVRNAIFDIESDLDLKVLGELSVFLNQELAGVRLADLQSYLKDLQEQVSDELSEIYRTALDWFTESALLQEEDSVILEGTHWIFSTPEFRDVGRTHRLIEALQNKKILVELLRKDLAASRVKLHIGSENKGTPLTDCTIVSAPYRLGGGTLGAIGILGPIRMDYPRVTGLVQRMAESVTQAFEN